MSELDGVSDWSGATGMSVSIYNFGTRTMIERDEPTFCEASCPLAMDGTCDPVVAHSFGSYEAERWSGESVYYCPAGLTFVATLTYHEGSPDLGVVTGPIAMGDLGDVRDDAPAQIRPLLAALPLRTAEEVNGLARTQRALCQTWSTGASPLALPRTPPTGIPSEGGGFASTESEYPVEQELRLADMVRRGDKAGAAQLINQLLAVLFMVHAGDMVLFRKGASDIVALFSRAAIEGGADPQAIFGEKDALDEKLNAFTTFDEVSELLVSVFHRFVGYVFDFSQFQHADALRKAVEFIRGHYAERISLADAARHVWLSPSYLSSIFSSEMGMSFSACVQNVRIQKSKELLLDTHLPISRIAADTGFSDQSYFTKVFTRSEGSTPSRYRREGRSHRGQG